MKRSGFASKVFERPPRPPLRPLARPSRAWTQGAIVPVEKENALQHAGYINLVRSMKCYRCGHRPRSQFCHADEGKGGGIKTDCRRGWPGCAACHEFVGRSGELGKTGRRVFEARAGAATRAEILRDGNWPKRLPRWIE